MSSSVLSNIRFINTQQASWCESPEYYIDMPRDYLVGSRSGFLQRCDWEVFLGAREKDSKENECQWVCLRLGFPEGFVLPTEDYNVIALFSRYFPISLAERVNKYYPYRGKPCRKPEDH